MSLANVANNIAGLTLASPYTAGTSSTFVLSSGASLLPAAPFRITVVTEASYKTATEVLSIYEVSVVNVGTQTLTVGVSSTIEGTTDRNYAAGDIVDLRVTSGTIADINTLVTPLGTTQSATAVLAGPTPSFRNLTAADLPPLVLGSATYTANSNNINNLGTGQIPTLGSVSRIKITASATLNASSQMPNITGIAYPSVTGGQILILENVGTFPLRLDSASGSSSAGNQFSFTLNYMYLMPSDCVTLVYDATIFSGSGGWLSTHKSVNVGHQFYGSGSDGNVTVNNSQGLTRDMFYQNLTLVTGAVLNPSGYRIYVSEVLDLSNAPAGAITRAPNNGANASSATGATGGFGGSSNHVGAGITGGTGGTGTSGSGGNASGTGLLLNAVNSNAAASGAGGNGSSANAGNGATPAGSLSFGPFLKYNEQLLSGTTLLFGGGAGAGGGGGGGDTSASGGGGGGGGGSGAIIWIAARCIYRAGTPTGVIAAKGGNGGNGFAPISGVTGGGGGGSGGAGGWVWIAYDYLAGTVNSTLIDVSGGNGGNGAAGNNTGTAGTGGAQGNGGRVTLVNTLAGSTAAYGANSGNNNTGTAGGAASGTTGGTGVSSQYAL